MTYQNILRDFSPQQDLKSFNDFFNFRTIKKSLLNEIQDDISDFDSANEEDEEEDDDDEDGINEVEQQESGLEENVNSVEDLTEAPDDDDDDDNSESWKSESVSGSAQSTLRRFNSTPEMEVPKQSSRTSHSESKKDLPPISRNNLLMKSVNEKMNLRSNQSNKKRTNKSSMLGDHDVDDHDEDAKESDDEFQRNKNYRSNMSRPSSVRSIRKNKQ